MILVLNRNFLFLPHFKSLQAHSGMIYGQVFFQAFLGEKFTQKLEFRILCVEFFMRFTIFDKMLKVLPSRYMKRIRAIQDLISKEIDSPRSSPVEPTTKFMNTAKNVIFPTGTVIEENNFAIGNDVLTKSPLSLNNASDLHRYLWARYRSLEIWSHFNLRFNIFNAFFVPL
ncbi:hypothetical protein BDF21DRAFT_449191 [Thamnidium elegans]|nr:hypothetical protein BDF21DRAFT_449191 [Thamnidium elegans]